MIEIYQENNLDLPEILYEICPYTEKGYKKIGENEMSYLPLRLAMNPGFEKEKREAEKYLAGLKIINRKCRKTRT